MFPVFKLGGIPSMFPLGGIFERLRPHAVHIILLAIWIPLGVLFVNKTTDRFSHDLDFQVSYTQAILHGSRLPLPHDGGVSYHPPLYFFITSLIAPDKITHVYRVRMASIVYGALAILFMAGLL